MLDLDLAGGFQDGADPLLDGDVVSSFQRDSCGVPSKEVRPAEEKDLHDAGV